MKVLYIQHVSVLGGSSRSMLELIENLPKGTEVEVLCPEGSFSKLLNQKNIKVHNIIGVPQFDNTRIGHYRKFRWLILLREFFYFPFLFFKILSLKHEKYDIVHVNEGTQIYSVVLSKIFLASTVVHVRSLQATKKNLRYKALLKILKKYADVIIAIDESVKNTLDSSLNPIVVHNGISFNNVNLIDSQRETFTVGIVANFQRYKGILEFIDAADICINKRNLEIRFLIFGAEYNKTNSMKERMFQAFGFRENLEDIVEEKLSRYKFGDRLELKGYVYKSDDIFNNIDLLTFPSHLNAVGRPVFEAGFYKVPSIVAIKDPFDDTIIDGVTGICIKEKDASALANAIEKLYDDRVLLERMGKSAYNQAHTLFDSKKNSQKVYEVYQGLLST